MSQLKQIDNNVKLLYESATLGTDIDDSKKIVGDLGAAIISSVSEKNIDQICSTVFNSDYGVLAYLKEAGGSKDSAICSAVAELLSFLSSLMSKRRKYQALQLYAADLVKRCNVISRPGSGNANCRGNAIELLTTLLDRRNKFDTSGFDIPALYKKYALDYTLPKTKLPSGVRGKLFGLLGTMARYYFEFIGSERIIELKRWCFDRLNQQLRGGLDTELQVISGALYCLYNIIYCDDQVAIKPYTDDSAALFKIILTVLQMFQITTRYDPVIAALALFKDHIGLFSNYLPLYWKELFDALNYWASHHNPQTYKHGLGAFEQFIKQLSIVLYHNYEGRNEKQMFVYMMGKFNYNLRTADNLENFYKVSLSIRGIGYFAKVCTRLLKDEEITALRNNLIKISDWFYSDTNTGQRDYARHLPAFIKAYSLFAAEFDTIPTELMSTLHRMCNIYIMGFVNMSGYHRRNGLFNIRALFGMLHQKGEGVFRNFLNDFFEKALICTCTDIESSDEENRPAYTDLLYFWKTILNNTQDSNFIPNKEEEENDEEEDDSFYRDTSVAESANLCDTLYDSFLLVVLKLTKTFNLKLKNVAEDAEGENQNVFSSVSNTLQPVNQKDFILFQNLVEFWCLILKELDNKRLSDWVYIVGTTVIDQSVLNPLVSGFYKMMSQVMIVCEQSHFFSRCKEYHSQTKYQLDQGKHAVPKEYATFLIFREYIKEVWHRLQQFTDELLASCLRLILAYPIAFFNLQELVTPLIKALKLGITYHPLATISMDSLDKLLDPKLGYDINAEFLSRILPCINEYLLVGVVSMVEEGVNLKKKTYKAPTAAERRYKSVHIKMTSDQLGVAKSDYSSLPELQLRMMQFLGRLGGRNKQLLLNEQDSIQDNGMLAWDPVKRLKLRIPFRNSKVDVYLDEFLPRICELAESSPERQVKVAACELLHSLTLFMIGNAAFQAQYTKEASESDFHKIYLKIFPVMIRLAIDPDQVARDMYRLLYFQTIHWLTNNAQSENLETMALLSTCLEAACNTDAGLRDYGAECIQEFVKWSIKQSSRSTDGARNIKSLLKRLYNLMTSPSSTNRFGASLVFNRIYRLFREESVLVNEYTIEILGQLFVSLKMSEVDHPSIGTRDQIIEAISHIKRIIRAKVPNFLNEDKLRRAFIGADDVEDLNSLVQWSFLEIGKSQRTYAKVCMTFFVEFVVLLPGAKSAKEWLSKVVAKNHNYYVDVFEAGGLKIPCGDDEDKLLQVYASWIKRLNSALDGYIWLIERNVLDPYDLLQHPNSMLLKSADYFIKNTPYKVLRDKLHRSIIEKNKIVSTYSYISVRLIYFLNLIFKSPQQGQKCFNHMDTELGNMLYRANLSTLIAKTLLLPKQVSETIQSDQGNAVTNSGVARIFNIAKDYVVSMHEKSSLKFMKVLAVSIGQIIQDNNANILLGSRSNLERSALIEIIQTIDGLKLIQSLGALDLVCHELNILDDKFPASADEFCLALFNQYLNYCEATQDPLWIQLLGSTLIISFGQPGFSQQHAASLLGFSGLLENLNKSAKLNVFQKHREYIYECMAYYFPAFSPVLCRHIEDPLVRVYVSMFLEYLKQNRLSQRKLVFKFSDHLVNDPSLLNLLVTQSKTDDQLLDLIVSLRSLFGADPSIMSRSKRKPLFDILWTAFMNFLDKNNSFVIKNSALDLLAIYVCLDEEYTKQITAKLNESIVQDLPPETENLQKGTSLYNEYISYLDKLLGTMATFKSSDIFNLLTGVFVQEENHIHGEAIRKYLESFTIGLGLRHFMQVAEYCFREFKNEHNNIVQRHNLAELIISLSVGVDDRAVIVFYERNIEGIMSVIQRDLATNPNKQVDDWNEKSDCFRLIQALYDRLPKSYLSDQSNSIYDKWTSSTKNQAQEKARPKFTSVITHAFGSLRKTPILPPALGNDNGRRNAQFLYNRSVYNATASMVLCIGTNKTQGNLFFLQDSVYNTYPWEYVIDTTQEIYLGIQLEKPLLKSRLDDLRSTSGYSAEKNERNIAYMASAALSGSSFTQASLSDMILEEKQNEADKVTNDTSKVSEKDIDIEMADASNNIEDEGQESNEFEIDVLNENLIMKPLTEVIKKIHREMCPPQENPVDMPAWVKEMLRAFQNTGEINIKLHISKLITNYPFAFEKYASFWLLPLIELATKGDRYGCPINYFVQDLCIILIVWGKNSEIPSPRSHETRRILFEFIKFLIKNAYHDEQRIMQSNIQIIKGVFENWGKYIPVPTRTIYEQFNHTGTASIRNIVGLQVLSIVFLNDGNPYDHNEFIDLHDISEFQFYTDMAENINYKERKKNVISTDAAELMGMTIHYLKEHNKHCLEDVKRNYTNKIRVLFGSKRTNMHILKCMSRLSLRDIDMVGEFMSVIIQNFHQYANPEKLLAMSCIDACWKDNDMVFYKLTESGLERMISSRDENMQIASLAVLNKIFEILKEDQLKWVIRRISSSFSEHDKEQCRTLYYSFLKKAFQTSVVVDMDFKNEIKALLFKGLIDKNQNISQDIYDFVEQEFKFTDDISVILQKITSEMYMPETEDVYLLYSTRVVLNNTKKSYDFDQPIFDKPLPNARFDADYQNINTSWQNASSMMPLFRATQSQSLSVDDLELELRHTQSLLDFSITQGTGRSLLSTFNPEELSQDQEQSLLDQPKLIKKQTEKQKNPYYKKRFVLIPPGASNRFHSDRNEKLQKKLRSLKNTQKEASEKKVTLSRSYRVGELPDVQILFKDVLLPLEVLASADYNISRLLYNSLVVGIIKANDKDTTGYQTSIVNNIQRNVTNSTSYFTPTIGSFLRIFFELNVIDQPEKLIRTASSKSFNHHIGIALLEKQLESTSGVLTVKRKFNDVDRNDEMDVDITDTTNITKSRWIDLALLYKEIDEPEIFQNVYLKNVATKELTKEAINAEIRGEYIEAYNAFGNALEQDKLSPYEPPLWKEQMLYCHTQLSQWDEIATIVDERIGYDPNNIWKIGQQDPYFDYFVKSHTKFSVMEKKDENPIIKFFQEAMDNETHKEYLLKHYACDWTTACIFNGQYDFGLQLIQSSYNSLLAAWTTLHPLAQTSRLAKLSQLERTVEIEDYLKLVKKIKQDVATPDQIEIFFNALTKRYPDKKSDNIAVWDDVIDSRFAFIHDIKRLNLKNAHNEIPDLKQYAIKFVASLANAAIEQNNLGILSNIRSKFEELGAIQESKLSLLSFTQKRSLNSNDPNQHKYLVSALVSAVNYEAPINSTMKDTFKSQIILAHSFDIIKQQIVANPDLFDEMMHLYKSLRKTIAKIPGATENAEKFINYLEKTGYKNLEEAGKSISHKAPFYKDYAWKIGNYCDKSLRLLQDSTSILQPDIDPIQYSEMAVKFYFQAIDKGHNEATENFPRLLELLELYPEIGPVFQECSVQIDESWRFIRWIPQLVSYIETPIAIYIFPALYRIAEDYPKALYYPFRMSFEHYELEKHNLPENNRHAIEKINRMVHSPIMEEFSLELQRLTDPDHIMKDFLIAIKTLLLGEQIPKDVLISMYNQFKNLLLESYNSRMGKIPNSFNAKYKKGLETILGRNGIKLLDEPVEVYAALLDYYNANIKDRFLTTQKPTEILKSFAPWLASFKSGDFDEELEIPGQYDGLSKPYPELHAKVASFGSQILVMSSIRRPKRLTINGSDEKEYHFLVKGGEDLRLDQRIEQLFGVMNGMVKKNAFCSRQNIQVATYKVVPMSLNLGIIEWVNHTKPLKNCIENQNSHPMYWKNIKRLYQAWIVKHAPSSKNIAAPHYAAYADSRKKIEDNYDFISGMIPSTYLRDFVLHLASSPEAFLFLRKEFAHSLACISIFGYILGIGDRHLDNFLLDMKSGRLISIDFGHAFGSATEHLAIPEVVPFRLTPQLVGVLDPIGVSGILENAMTNILQAIQDEKDLLLNIMNVFVKDPLLDWKKQAMVESKSQKSQVTGTPSDTEIIDNGGETKWYPQRKLDIVKRKLNGENPARIAVTEIENGHSDKYYCKNIVSLTKGDPERDIRARVGENCKDAREQIKCLINLASDTSLLGVMYGGWTSFI